MMLCWVGSWGPGLVSASSRGKGNAPPCPNAESLGTGTPQEGGQALSPGRWELGGENRHPQPFGAADT